MQTISRSKADGIRIGLRCHFLFLTCASIILCGDIRGVGDLVLVMSLGLPESWLLRSKTSRQFGVDTLPLAQNLKLPTERVGYSHHENADWAYE